MVDTGTPLPAAALGRLVRQHRRAIGLTQEQLAEVGGVSTRTIQDVERGVAVPRRDTLERLVTALRLEGESRAALVAAAAPRPRSSHPMNSAPAPAVLRTNLPRQLTSFVGREREYAELRRLLGSTASLTLTGAGGVGKTRLALRLAAELLDEYADGVWFIDLAPLTDPALVPATIAGVLGVREASGSPLLETLTAYLRDKQLLLLLDNFEHVAEAATVVTEMLAAAPRVKIVVTSRVVLHLSHEQEYPVSPLGLPEPARPGLPAPSVERLRDYSAVELFIQRARRVEPGFRVTEENAPAVAEICVRLDGLPLAIELAAARARLFPTQALLARLEHRLPLLTSGPRDLPARQRTLRATLDWSYNLLGAAERTLFARLAVFAGGCSLEAVEAICNPGRVLGPETIDLVQSLVEQSFLRQTPGPRGEARFAMFETVREYAWDTLRDGGEVERVKDRHLGFFLALAEEAEAELFRAEQQEWLDRLELEQDNLRAALEWSIQNAGESGLRLAGALSRVWWVRSRFDEGRTWLQAALACTTGSSTARAKALHYAGLLASYQGDYGRGADLSRESLAMFRQAGDQLGIAMSCLGVAHAAMITGDHATATALCEESLAISTAFGDDWGIANGLFYLGSEDLGRGNYAEARPALEESLVRFRRLRDAQGTANTLCQLTYATAFMGDYESARVLSEEALTSMRSLGDRRNIARVLLALATAALNRGQIDAARDAFDESLGIFRELGDRWWGTVCLEGLASLAATQLRAERAAQLLGAVERLHDAMGAPVLPLFRPLYDRTVSTTRAQLTEAQFAAARAEGWAMTFEQAVAHALRD